MPIENLLFQGINRSISDFSANGACEELINLRPTTAGLVPVKLFAMKFSGVNYNRIYEHKASNATNYITFSVTDNNLIICFLDKNGNSICAPLEIEVSDGFDVSFVNCAATGNYILFSVTDKESVFENYAFLWDGTTYKAVDANIPQVECEFVPGEISMETKTGLPNIGINDEEKMAFVEALNSGINAVQELNPSLCFGPVIVAIAFKTKDGKTFWTSTWKVFDAMQYINVSSSRSVYLSPSDVSSLMPQGFKDNYDHGYEIYRHIPDTGIVRLTGLPLSLTLSVSGWDKDTSIIESVEVYASVPTKYIDTDLFINPDNGMSFSDFRYDNTSDSIHMVLPQVPYKDMGLDNQLLYLQESIPMSKFTSGEYTVDLVFGGNKQKTEKTLAVDSGAVSRYGKLLSYNARFHYYDSIASEQIGMPTFIFPSSAATKTRNVFFVVNNGIKDVLYYVGTAELPYEVPAGGGCQLIVAPSIRVSQVILVDEDSIIPGGVERYMMSKSKTYNYSICTEGRYDHGDYPCGADYFSEAHSLPVLIDESNAINVTEQYNPFVFNVDNSYLAPGHVREVRPQMVAVRDVSFGDYPLCVFTDRGVYALLQGSGPVLYSNFKSVSNLISESNAISTGAGTFFVASGGLWLLAGATAVLVSEALSLGPHKSIRSCDGFTQITQGVYNFGKYLSAVPFEDFVICANLSYNKYRDEVIVSNKEYQYSYVLSIKYRQWFKVSQQFSQDEPESDIIMQTGPCMAEASFNSLEFSALEGYTLSMVITHGNVTVSGDAVHVSGQSVIDVANAMFAELAGRMERTILEGTEMNCQYRSYSPRPISFYVFTLVFPLGVTEDVTASVTLSHASQEEPHTKSMQITGGRDVYDTTNEQEVSTVVHLQSRPFSFAFQFSHIHRVVAMICARLSGATPLVVSLYGSDDMRSWKLISFSSRKNVDISQIRTPASAHSWRYYVLCIGGHTPFDTDFGPVMLEYVPIIRRLG